MNKQAIESRGKSQLVTFVVGQELYGIDISRIQEVINFPGITSIPDSPPFIEGVIQVRNRVIPVVDLRKRLGIEARDTIARRVVILDLARPLALMVDDFSQVLNLDSSGYEALPEEVRETRKQSCVSGVIKTGNGLVIVISPDLIVSREEREALADLAPGPAEE